MTQRLAACVTAVLVLALVGGCIWADRSTETADAPAPSARILLDDDFSGAGLDRDLWGTCHWWGPTGCTIETNDELEWYQARQVEVVDGELRLTAEADPITVDEGRFPFRSGMVSSGPPDAEPGSEARFAFTYGRVEARLRVPDVAGTWPAVWLLPADRDHLPEIDLLEVYGSAPDQAQMTFHDDDGGRRRREVGVGDLSAGWHTVTLDWRPGSLVWSVDGSTRFTVTGDDVPDEPMYLVLNLAVGGPAGDPAPDAAFPATFVVDRVRVWAP